MPAKPIQTGIGNVVEDFYIGKTRIKICDDFCRDTTPEQVDEILRKIARDALPCLQQKMAREAQLTPA